MKKLFRKRKSQHTKQSGFSLLEVMIALVVSNVALLGLVAGELKSLQYAQNSFQYTVSLIHVNNAVEHILNDVCKLKSNTQKFNNAYADSLSPSDPNYTLSFDVADLVPAEADDLLPESLTVYMSWVDNRMDDYLNKVAITANFPPVVDGCSVDG